MYEGIEAMVARWDEALARYRNERDAHRFVRAFLVDHMLAEAGEGPHREHALFMFELVTRMTELDRIDDSFTVLNWIAELYPGQASPDMAVPSILALTDWAVRLSQYNAGHEQAKKVMRKAASRVAPSAHVTIQRVACTALAQVALLVAREPPTRKEDITQAMEPWRAIIDRWSGSEDAVLRFRLAQAQCNIGLLHLQLGEDRPAKERFAQAAALSRDSDSSSPAPREFFIVGETAGRLLSAIELPTSAAFKTGSLVMPIGRAETNQLIRIARNTHWLSVGKVKAWSCFGRPFALLLRNFDLREWALPDLSAQTFKFNRRGDQVLRQLGHEVPIVQVASTQSGELELDTWGWHGDPIVEGQLYLADDTWFDTVTHLITLAETIVIWAEAMTPPLAQELTALRSQGRTQDTIILIEEVDNDPIPVAGIAALTGLTIEEMRKSKPRREQLTPDSPALVGFPHVVDLRQALEVNGEADEPTIAARRLHHRQFLELPMNERLGRLLQRLGAEPRISITAS